VICETIGAIHEEGFDRITGLVWIDWMDGKRFATEFTESTGENVGKEWSGQVNEGGRVDCP
jgi:hypothetical protein